MPFHIAALDPTPGQRGYVAAGTRTNATDIINVTGQVGSAADGTIPSDYESQTHLALLNLHKVLAEGGASISDILKINLYIVNYNPQKRLHTRILTNWLAGHRPACTLIPVSQLAHPEWLFEIDAVAARKNDPSAVALQTTRSLGVSQSSVDVVVIGAGLAGLNAATKIKEAGLSCMVLEARDRVGGRTWSQPLADGRGIVELGAAWINDTNQTVMAGLARKFGLELLVQSIDADCTLQDENGQVSTFRYGDLPQLGAAVQRDIAQIRDCTEADSQSVDCARPRNTNLDTITFATYLRQNGAKGAALKTASIWCRVMLGREPEDVSALFFLNYCKSGGGLLNMRNDGKGGAQALRVRQGTQSFSKGLAAELGHGVVHLSTPVHAIQQTEGRMALVHTGSRVVAARKVITTVPPAALKHVEFSPPLPRDKQVLIDSFRFGFYRKVMGVFKEPFWLKKGHCGLTQSFTGPSSVIRDSSSPADGKWVLTCFVTSNSGAVWAALPQAEAYEQLLSQICKLYDSPEARDLFVEFVSSAWDKDPLTGGGCPAASLSPGVLDSIGHTLREPFGLVHFAGTETAAEWKGYMEGASRSGQRAADEVIADLLEPTAKL
ncbi:flavin-containing amine oxidoreductase, partial [Aureobasidium melanogenum]